MPSNIMLKLSHDLQKGGVEGEYLMSDCNTSGTHMTKTGQKIIRCLTCDNEQL